MTAHSDSTMTMLDTLQDEGVTQEEELMASEQQVGLNDRLDSALGALDRRERYIVEQRIMGDDEMSLAELGRRLGVSRERARQIEARAKRKLRKRLVGLESHAA
jgi:RNA polymerase sigma-32 factor